MPFILFTATLVLFTYANVGQYLYQ